MMKPEFPRRTILHYVMSQAMLLIIVRIAVVVCRHGTIYEHDNIIYLRQ